MTIITKKRKKIIRHNPISVGTTIRHKGMFCSVLFVGSSLVGFKNNSSAWVFINKSEPIETYQLAASSYKNIKINR